MTPSHETSPDSQPEQDRGSAPATHVAPGPIRPGGSRNEQVRNSVRGRNYADGAAALSPRSAGASAQSPGVGNGVCSSEPPTFGREGQPGGSATVVGTAADSEWAFDASFTPALVAEMKAHPELEIDEILVRVADRELRVANSTQPEQHPTVAQFGQTTQNTNMTRAGQHLAVLVANSTYPAVGSLQTPLPEAQGFRASLAARGYAADPVVPDLQAPEMASAYQGLINRAQANDDVVAYYAGHGAPEGLVGVAHGVGGKADILPNARVADLVGQATAKGAHIRFIMDSCHSGAASNLVRTERAGELGRGSNSKADTALLAATRFASWCKDGLVRLATRRNDALEGIRENLDRLRAHPPPTGAKPAAIKKWNDGIARLGKALVAVQTRYDDAMDVAWLAMRIPLGLAAGAISATTSGKIAGVPAGVQNHNTLGQQLDWLDDLANLAMRPVDREMSEAREH